MTTDTSILVKNADYDAKIKENEAKISAHGKYITHEFNELMTDNFAVRLKEAYLVSKKDIADFVKKILMKN